MALEIKDEDIGGACVIRGFSMGAGYVKRGDKLTREQVISMSKPNRKALINANYIEVFFLNPDQYEGQERFIIGLGKDKFSVIEGRQLNQEPLTRAEAEALLHAKH